MTDKKCSICNELATRSHCEEVYENRCERHVDSEIEDRVRLWAVQEIRDLIAGGADAGEALAVYERTVKARYLNQDIHD